MRYGLVFLLSTSLMSTLAIPAAADPMGDLDQARKAFTALNSVHADVATSNGEHFTIDIVKPHKFHAKSSQGEMISDGTAMWVNMRGSWMKLPTSGHESIIVTLDESQSAGQMAKIKQDCTATDGGPATIVGVSTEVYHLKCKSDNEPADIWVGPGHLPVRIGFNKSKGVTTITYSRYNGVPDIAIP